MINEIVYWLFIGWWRSPVSKIAENKLVPSGKKRSASILILNWNGRSLLAECLPSVVDAVEHEGGNHEIIIIDNGSMDDSREYLLKHFPQVKVLALSQNYSFVEGYNRGIHAATKDVLVFLNNDMFVDIGFLHPLLDGFTDDSVFSVSSQIFFHDPNKRREETGKTRTVWYKGMLGYRHEVPHAGDVNNRYVPAFWLGGGSAAVDHQKFLEIGGFDSLLRPLYTEDVDLSYQAWKRGWKVLFCPESVVIHKHRSSSSRMDRSQLDRIIARNHILFIWKNITNSGMLLDHLIHLPFTGLRRSWGLKPKDTLLVFLMALARFPHCLLQRNRQRVHYRVGDRDVFRIANSTFDFKERFLPPRKVSTGDRLKILFICPYYPSLYHGGGVRMYQMIRHLSYRHDVSLLTFWDNEEDKRYFEDMERFCVEVKAIRRKPKYGWDNFWKTIPPAVSIDFGDPHLGELFREMLANNEYDIVQVEFLQMAYQIPRLRRQGLFLTEHEVQHSAWFSRLSQEPLLGRKLHLFLQWIRWLNVETMLGHKFDRIAAVTEEDAWALTRFDPSLPVEVIHTCVDTEYYTPIECEQEPDSIMYVGNFRHTPNVDSALFLAKEIMPRVWAQNPNVKLYIVGSGPTPAVQALAEPDRVVVTGWVEDMRPYMNRTQLYVVPIRLGVGIRNKILEAWAMGKPVITTPLGCAGLNAQHGENIWIAETIDEFADGIVSLLKAPALLKKLGRNGRHFVDCKRSWNVAAAKQVKSYFEVIESKTNG